jgi:hypothetical protein
VKLVPFKYVEPLTRQRLMDEMEADHDAVSALDKLGIPFKDARLENMLSVIMEVLMTLPTMIRRTSSP